MSDVVYRDAVGADAGALADFCARTFIETFGHLYPPEDLSTYLRNSYTSDIQAAEIAEPGIRYRLALRDECIVGYAMAGPLDIKIDAPAGSLELYRLYVDEGMKGAGVAQTLMQDCIEWVRRSGGPALYLSVWENNHRAQRFYKRYGFEHLGEHKFMVGRVADRDFIWRVLL